jgi:D-aminopeptidase
MRVVLSADMEGISQISSLREILATCPEYWDAGRAKLTADVAAAAEGLLAGGADEVVVLDNHASGNPENLLADRFPSRVRVETWNVFDLPDHHVDAMLQGGYHPAGGRDGFAPHSYIPGLRLRVGDVEVSESHGRAWAAGVPLLGVTGHAEHGRRLGALGDVPFLAVQDGNDRLTAHGLFDDADAGLAAIHDFARASVAAVGRVDAAVAPEGDFVATLDGRPLLRVPLGTWADAREPLATAMAAALEPFAKLMGPLDLSSRDALSTQPADALNAVADRFADSL